MMIMMNIDADSCTDDWQPAGRSLVWGVGTRNTQ